MKRERAQTHVLQARVHTSDTRSKREDRPELAATGSGWRMTTCNSDVGYRGKESTTVYCPPCTPSQLPIASREDPHETAASSGSQ